MHITKVPKTLESAFELVCREMLGTFIKKHKDYGKGNILDTGELGIAFRVNDKLNRIKNLLLSKQELVNESMEDSWLDIAVYAIIAILYRKSWFKNLKLRAEK